MESSLETMIIVSAASLLHITENVPEQVEHMKEKPKNSNSIMCSNEKF